jgi:hypothetical protein
MPDVTTPPVRLFLSIRVYMLGMVIHRRSKFFAEPARTAPEESFHRIQRASCASKLSEILNLNSTPDGHAPRLAILVLGAVKTPA